MRLVLAIISLMLGEEKITECYTIPSQDNNLYCYTMDTKEYIIDYLSEIILVNYYKTIDK